MYLRLCNWQISFRDNETRTTILNTVFSHFHTILDLYFDLFKTCTSTISVCTSRIVWYAKWVFSSAVPCKFHYELICSVVIRKFLTSSGTYMNVCACFVD